MSHFYLPDGRPFYRTIGAKGQERDVTLRDARQCGAAPSVTTVLEVLPKPALERWKVQQGILAALTMPRGEDSEEAWLAKVMADSKRQAKEAAEEGNRIHNAIERHFQHRVLFDQADQHYEPHVRASVSELVRLFPNITDWASEKSFYHPIGFGGKVDLHSPSTGIVVDFKGKDGDFSDGKKLAYDQNIQLAAYQVGLGLGELRYRRDVDGDPMGYATHVQCANIFVSRTHPGKVASHVWDEREVEYGWEVFRAALTLWQKLNRYVPKDYIQPCAA